MVGINRIGWTESPEYAVWLIFQYFKPLKKSIIQELSESEPEVRAKVFKNLGVSVDEGEQILKSFTNKEDKNDEENDKKE